MIKLITIKRYEIALTAIILFLTFFRLDAVPPLWWDEGWTLSVARNWFETGHYKRLLEGQLSPRGLEAAPTVTASVYLAFQLFGVGVVQARMVGIVYTFATLLVVYYLARRLYNREIALATLLVLSFTPSYVELVPMYAGRQVLAEMPAIFFLLLGYASFLLAFHRHMLWLLFPIICWSVALSTKAQVMPFWLCSIFVTLIGLVYQKQWRSSLDLTFGCVGSLIGSQLLFVLWRHFLWLDASTGGAVMGLYEVTAAVASIPARLFALIVTGLFGLPTLAGLCHAAWSMLAKKDSFGDRVEHIRLSLVILAGSWFAWFVLLSVGWIRYIFPAIFMGSIFVAAMIFDLTRGFDVTYTIHNSLAIFKGRGFNRQAIGTLFVAVIVVTSIPRTAIALYEAYILDADTSVRQAAEFINSQTQSDALIETYDSELFFFLNRPYHYPPDQVHVQLIRRTFLYEDNTRIGYDPLAADPDYLVVGPHSKKWRLYDDVLKTGTFHLVRTYRRYRIYERVR